MADKGNGQACGSGCGRLAGKSKSGLCQDCAEIERRQRWREKNPTFKEMVEMDDVRLEEALNRLFVVRSERSASLHKSRC